MSLTAELEINMYNRHVRLSVASAWQLQRTTVSLHKLLFLDNWKNILLCEIH